MRAPKRLLAVCALFPLCPLCAGVAATSGCGLLFGLDGLEGGACTSGCGDASAAVDEGALRPSDGSTLPETPVVVEASPSPEASESDAPPVDARVTDEADAPVPPVCTPPTPPTLDDCTGLIPMPTAPVIDGVLDCGVALWPMPASGWTGTGPIPSGVSTSVAAAYRSDGLYFFVRVTGAGPKRYPAPAGTGQWCGDAVELFVDDDGMYMNPPFYDNPGTMQFIAVAPSDAETSSTVGETFRDSNDNGAWNGEFVSVRTADGFDVEAFIKAADLGLATWLLSPHGRVGLDVSVDLGSAGGQPASCPVLGQYTIQVPQTDASCDQAACNVAEFCDPRLQ